MEKRTRGRVGMAMWIFAAVSFLVMSVATTWVDVSHDQMWLAIAVLAPCAIIGFALDHESKK